jgi:hypothetical protein
MTSLQGRRFRVASTSAGSVVSASTILTLEEDGPFVCGRYSGGTVVHGYLIGIRRGAELHFRYVQGDLSGSIDAGVSRALIEVDAQGLVRITEHYEWATREGSGTNIFEEIAGDADA